MSSIPLHYLTDLINECDAMLHILVANENAVISGENRSNIIMQINSTKEYLVLLKEKENHRK